MSNKTQQNQGKGNGGAATSANRVGGGGQATPPVDGDKKQKKTKLKYHNIPKDGLTAMPDDYSFEQHERLGKKDFADKATAIDYRASMMRWRGNKMLEKATAMFADAENARKYGDDKTQKRIKKVGKIQSTLAALLAELKNEGVDTDSLLKTVAAPAAAAAK